MSQASNVAEWVSTLAERFQAKSGTARLDAQNLVAHAAGRDRTWILAHPEAALTLEQESRLREAAREIDLGTPLPYILGTWEFYALSFTVSPAVLIPRPETELLVETAIEWYRNRVKAGTSHLKAVDVGTGSGCIAVSAALHTPQMYWTACDISRPALHIASRNAKMHETEDRIAFAQSDLISAFAENSFDLVCANLPYIPTSVLAKLTVFEREPTLALDGGPDGLDLIRRLLDQAQTRLSPGGLILAEIEALQGSLALTTARKTFPQAHIRVKKDYAGHNRLLVIKLTEEGKQDAN